MRVLFTTQKPQAATSGLGHLHPLVPLARAAQTAGHQVAFACPRSLGPLVEASGFRAFPAGRDDDGDPDAAAVMAQVHRTPPGPELTRFFIANVFVRVNARLMVPDLLAVCRAWRPDLLVRENTEFGGAIVAERLGLPHAGVEIVLLTNFTTGARREPISTQLDRVRQLVGLPPDPALAMLYRYLHLSFTPPRLQDPAVPLPATLHALRATPFDRSGTETLPAWVRELPARPTVYATLGSEMNKVPGLYPRLLQTVIAGLREHDLTLIVTVGRGCDPEALGPQPPHVHVERYIPQSLLLPHCALALSHGGTTPCWRRLPRACRRCCCQTWRTSPTTRGAAPRWGWGGCSTGRR